MTNYQEISVDKAALEVFSGSQIQEVQVQEKSNQSDLAFNTLNESLKSIRQKLETAQNEDLNYDDLNEYLQDEVTCSASQFLGLPGELFCQFVLPQLNNIWEEDTTYTENNTRFLGNPQHVQSYQGCGMEYRGYVDPNIGWYEYDPLTGRYNPGCYETDFLERAE